MDFTFSDDQTLFRNTVRDLLQKECPPTLVRQAWSADPPLSLWSRLADLGLLAATLPESEGGLGLGDLDLVLIHEECGRVALPLPFLETSVAIPLLTLAPAAFQAEWLPKITTGQAIVAVSLDAAPFINTAPSPDLVLLAHEGDLHALLPADLTLTPHSSVDGSRKLARVDWHPSPRTRIAADVTPALRTAFDRGALAASAQLVGLAQQMLDLTVAYTKIRKQFGKPIGSFQAVKHHLADALLALEMARPVVYRAAYSLAHQAPAASLHVSAAKARASEAALLVGRKALQCHGAIAYSYEHDLHLWMKRTWSLAAAWGDAAYHRTRIAEQIL